MRNEVLKGWITKAFLFACIGGALVGCLKNDLEDPLTPEEWLEKQLKSVDKVKLASDIAVINDSLEKWELNSLVLTEPQGVRYIIDEVLDPGPTPTLRSGIVVNYRAILLSEGLDGEEFEASENLQYPLYGLIMGWQTTLPLLQEGTKARLFIPSGLAYGTTGAYNQSGVQVVPPNANLIFEIELIEVN